MKDIKVSLLVMLFVFSVFSIAWAGWSANDGDQYISSFSPSNRAIYSTAAAAGPSGNLYAIWIQQWYELSLPYQREIYFSMSTDNGYTWTGTIADQMISANDGEAVYNPGLAFARRIDIAVDSEERIFVIWPEPYTTTTYNEVMLVVSSDSGATWLHSDFDFPISSLVSSQPPMNPKMCVDTNDDIHVVWHQDPGDGTSEIFYTTSTDHGANWSAERVISFPDGFDATNVDITSDSQGDIYIVWLEKVDADNWAVHFGKKEAGQPNFSSETSDIAVSPLHSNLEQFPRITSGPSDYLHVAYPNGYPNSDVFYIGSTDGGSIWSNSTIWLGTGYNVKATDIVATSAGDLAVVFDEEYPGTENPNIYASYSLDNGATWSTELDFVSHYDVGSNFDRGRIPDVLCTAGDTLHAIFYENYPSSSNSYQEACYSRGDTLATGGGPGCDYVPGDANGDGNVMGNDVTYSVRYFKGLGANPPDSCWNADAGEWLYSGGDANGNCAYTGSDVTFLVAYFKGYNLEILYCEHTPPIGGGLSSLKAWNRPER